MSLTKPQLSADRKMTSFLAKTIRIRADLNIFFNWKMKQFIFSTQKERENLLLNCWDTGLDYRRPRFKSLMLVPNYEGGPLSPNEKNPTKTKKNFG